MKRITRILPVALFCLVAACAGAPKAMAGGAAVNTACPISGEAIEAGAPTIDYMGHKLAFCCDHCVDKWNGMDDAKKQASYAKVTK